MTDAAAVSIASGFFTLLGTIFTGIVAYLMARLKGGQDRAAAQAEEVKVALDQNNREAHGKLDDLATVTHATHVLVNNNMGVQLRVNATLARRLAKLTGDPADIRAAEVAEGLVAEHESKQAAVDAQPGTAAQKQGRGSAPSSPS